MDKNDKEPEVIRIKIVLDDRDMPYLEDIAAKLHVMDGIKDEKEKAAKQIQDLQHQTSARDKRLAAIDQHLAKITDSVEASGTASKVDATWLKVERGKLAAETRRDTDAIGRLQRRQEKLNANLKKAQDDLEKASETLGIKYRIHHPEGPQRQ